MIMVDFDRSNPQGPPRYQQQQQQQVSNNTSSSSLSSSSNFNNININHHQQQQHRGSPHLQHLDHPSPHSTPSPTFSYAQPPLSHLSQQQQQLQQQQGVRQNITSYPSPGSYPSPSMSSAYSYPPGQQPGSHRDSPTYASATLPAVSSFNLPPIRLAPPPTSSPVPQHNQLGSPLPAPAPSLHNMQNYYQQMPGGQAHGHITSSPLHQPMRYPLPSVAQPERIMSGGRHKKEIKRRTKTGCLTCRKRRIKCDEAHPSCKNCAKSKRECLGYDPIFKSQAGPAPIQPAPSNGPAPIAPAGYPMHGAPMAMTMPSHMPTSIPMGYGSALSATGSSPRSVYDYDPYPAIDPALESAILPPPHSPSVGERLLHDTNGSFRPDLKRSYDRASPFSSASDSGRTMGTPVPRSSTPGASNYSSNYGYPRDDLMMGLGNSAKRIKINDLLTGGIPPPPTPPPSENAYISGPDGTRQLFQHKYAGAFDQIIGTGWFGNECVTSLLMNNGLVETLADFLERLKSGEPLPAGIDADFRAKGAQDGVILYNVMRLIYSTRVNNDEIKMAEDSMDYNKVAKETLERVRTVEALVWGDHLDVTSGFGSPQFNFEEEQQEKRESNFWSLLRRFISLRDDSGVTAKETLDSVSKFIDNQEGRDILFSIAMARHLNSMLNDKDGPPQSPGQFRLLSDRLLEYQMFIKKLASSPVDVVNCVIRRLCARSVASWGAAEGSISSEQ